MKPRAVTQPDKTGRARARLLYPAQPCEECGREPAGRGTVDRHHRNADRMDNSPTNIVFLCRRHHNAAHRLLDGKVGGGPRPRVAALMHDRAVASWEQAKDLLEVGATYAEVAWIMGVNPWTVHRWKRKYEGLVNPVTVTP